uniref:Tripartite motif-containing protein 3-like n=1 Tax=Crassostrea virginica TaxID=6565 RepID=A0A8B8E9E9_CRAVI|nr:tripartite motif-containing protein 3-like [Crassostrea virginica]
MKSGSMETSVAQDVSRCDVCEEEAARMHCDPCVVSLCKVCVGEHFSSDLSRAHKIVDFKDRNSTPLLHKCSLHDNEPCELFCQQCGLPVCASCLSSDGHLGHSLSKYLHVLNERKEKVLKEKATLEEAIYPTYQFISDDAENAKAQLDKKYEDLLTLIETQEEDWHSKVKKVADKLKTKAKKMRRTQTERLQQHSDAMKAKLANIQTDISSCQNVLDTNDVSKLADFECLYVEKYTKLPEKIKQSLPTFNPGEIDRENLGKLFGKLSLVSLSSVASGYSFRTLDEPLQEPREETDRLASPTEPLQRPREENDRLAAPTTVTSIRIGHRHLYDVACQSEKEILTSGNGVMIRLYNINRKSQLSSIRTKSKKAPTNLAVTHSGDLVYSDSSSKTVNVVRGGKIHAVVTLRDWKPQGVCGTSSGELLVIMDREDKQESRVVRYSGGIARQSTQFDCQGKPLYSTGSIKYIAENRNLDVCVTDSKRKAVVVTSETGGLRFRYTGPSPTPRNKAFYPVGIATDSGSGILTADYFNQCVHVIAPDGQFLRYLDCGLQDPWGLCTDREDNLFVVECIHQRVTKVKYLQ